MADIYLALVIVAGLSVGLFLGAVRLSKSWAGRTCDVAAVVTILVICVYIRCFWDQMILAEFLPFSNLIIVGNWFPLAAGILAGLVWRRVDRHVVVKVVLVTAIGLTAAYALYHPLMGSPVSCDNTWEGKVCMQTSAASCSAASAATLLKAHGIDASESEMAELCLTRKTGTHWMGLYRGLKLKTAETDWYVEPLSCDLQALQQLADLPVILFVKLAEKGYVDPSYEAELGWLPGVDHSIVLFGFPGDERFTIGDPSNGLETWEAKDMKTLWHGKGIRLVKRGNQ
jgi:hypothetical protein